MTSWGHATTIDEVIAQMDEIIAWSIAEKSRLGYFAALYRKVTVQVKEGIQTGLFEDGARMERLDVTFANRYLEALQAYRTGQPVSECWKVAFDRARQGRLIILQHLLLGMNAHINLDLGIAAAQTCPGAEIASLQHDFMKINDVLASLVDDVEEEIGELSPWIRLLERLGSSVSDAIVNFSMRKARDAAWEFAGQLAPLPAAEQEAAIHNKDQEMAQLGRTVAKPPGWFFRLGLTIIRLRESGNITRIIRVLNQAPTAPAPVDIDTPLAQG